MNVIEVKNLTKKYKTFTLDNISFSLEEGVICGFIGENGAGKSTTMKILANITSRNSGDVKILGKDVNSLTSLERENVSFILDELNFPDNIKIFQVEKILKNIFKNWERDTFFNYLRYFSLDQNKKIKELSKGMKVKLNFAIALSHKAKVFILDEPTNGLDPIIRDEMLDVLVDIKNKGGTVFISTHIVEDLERISKRIIFIHEGKIIIDDLKEKILNTYDLYEVDNETYNNLDKSNIIKVKDEDLKKLVLTNKNGIDEKYKVNLTLKDLMIMFVRGQNV